MQWQNNSTVTAATITKVDGLSDSVTNIKDKTKSELSEVKGYLAVFKDTDKIDMKSDFISGLYFKSGLYFTKLWWATETN